MIRMFSDSHIKIRSFLAFIIYELQGSVFFSSCDAALLTMQLEFVMSDVFKNQIRGSPGRDRMVLGFTTTYSISAYHH
jgi:hypothetical protein